ncbi:Type IV pilus biogenesis [Pseudomonas sp. NFIX10]|uniref:type II secretion system protein N n=1 Tax=unclassified Pseudomonas TaxID=196821 RepID=UPI0008DF81EF|nr:MULTISPECIES: type II secretion system protein N [unclassified Pseudomonas]SFB59636.1 Type IV pilus biogenesis [Pseudomonas sp. NFIX10]SFF55757.1 Type IV pilus biogenesis [Pseudomonas sp. NFACC06-1]
MSVSFKVGSRLPTTILVLVPLLYGVLLAGQEWRYRQAVARAVPVVGDSSTVPVRALPNVQAVATVFGLTPEDAQAPSTEPITLQASFVAGQGLSRALLADAAGPRIYQVGERLPGGSVLRRVETSHVTLWRNGREERLALQPAAKPLLRRLSLEDGRHAAPHSSQYLRPVAGQSE